MRASLDAVHKRYVRNEVALGCVINALLAFAFTWLIFLKKTTIALWGADGIALDLIITVFMLTLFAGSALTLITRKRVQAGRIPRLRDQYALRLLGVRVPGNVWLRCLITAVLMVAIFGPLSIGTFVVLDITVIGFWPFVAFKIVYGALIGALSAPLLLIAALADGLR